MKLLSGAMVYCDVKETDAGAGGYRSVKLFAIKGFLGILKFNLKSGQQAYPHLLFLPKSA
jgi:hypothetical protein